MKWDPMKMVCKQVTPPTMKTGKILRVDIIRMVKRMGNGIGVEGIRYMKWGKR